MHAIAHGDVSLLNRLDVASRDGLDAKGKTASAMHLSGFRKYVLAYAPVSWAKRDKTTGKDEHFAHSKDKAEALLAKYEADKTAFVDNLLSTPFYVVNSQPNFEGFSIPRLFWAMMDQYDRIQDNDEKADHPKNNFTGIEKLREVAASIPKPEKKKRTKKDKVQDVLDADKPAAAPAHEGVLTH